MWNDHKGNGNMKPYLFNGRLNEQPLQKSMPVLYHDQEVRSFLYLKTVNGSNYFLARQIVEQVGNPVKNIL